MNRTMSLTVSSAVLMVLVAAYALFDDMDLCFFFLEIVSLLVLISPFMFSKQYVYSNKVLAASLVSQISIVAVMVFSQICPTLMGYEFWMISVHTYLIQTTQIAQAFVTGLMVMLVLTREGFTVTKRWIILAAMFTSLGYGVLCLFGNFLGLYFDGIEVYAGLGGYAAQQINANVMSCAFTGTFVSAILAILTTRCFRNDGLNDIIVQRCE